MSLSITHPVSLLNIVELVLTIIEAGLIGNLACINGISGNIYNLQYITAVVYGFLIVGVITVASNFLSKNLDKTVRLLLAGGGSILWLAAAALLLEAGDTGYCRYGESYDRAIAAGVLGLALFIGHAIDAYFSYRHLEE